MAILTATLRVQMLVGRGMTKQFKTVICGHFVNGLVNALNRFFLGPRSVTQP